MNSFKQSLKSFATGIAFAFYVVTPAVAEDIEIYTQLGATSVNVQPNILFILDSSISMRASITVKQTAYDPLKVYPGSADPTRLYFATGATPSLSDYVDYSAFQCDHALNQYDATETVIGTEGPLETVGFFTDQLAQFSTNSSTWTSISDKNATIRAQLLECLADSGIHGAYAAPTPKKFIKDTAVYSSNDSGTPAVWSSGGNNYTVYHANYVNYLNDSSSSSTSTRFEEMQTAILALTTATNNINIALQQFDKFQGLSATLASEGGAILYAMEDIKSARNDFQARVKTMSPDGSTPLGETYWEALRYYGGQTLEYGKAGAANPGTVGFAIEGGTNPKTYETPVTQECQKNVIVYLTDGAPTFDALTTARLAELPGFDTTLCADSSGGSLSQSLTTNCLEFLAEWANNNDIARRSDLPAHDGLQTITTYTIGFDLGPGLVDTQNMLVRTAKKGGGSYNVARDAASLTVVFNKLIAEILAVNTTFSSPAVSVNAFNRSTHLSDLYFTLFKPASGNHWNGNLKKYKIAFNILDGTPFVADANGDPAIDSLTGFFSDNSTSFWTLATDAPDGEEAAIGGAASILTYGAGRNMYTYTGTYTDVNGVKTPATGNLTIASNELDTANAAITDAMLGGVASNPDVNVDGIMTPFRTAMLNWAGGKDVFDDDGDGVFAEARRVMGDPLHGQPALVQYGGTDAAPDLVSFVTTNDGYLHAINTDDGTEYWAFVPQELLSNLEILFNDTGVGGKTYGLDGDVVPWINDVDKDGLIEPTDGDFVYLFFGMRRGGNMIYSMDVTDRTAPKLRWIIQGGSGDYAELGDTWSTINFENIKVGEADRKVLIFGGGYDVTQDDATIRTVDAVGRAVFITDALTGEVLWQAGPDSSANLRLDDMEYSIPSRMKPLDISGNGAIDRLYVGDMGGQLWRFDIALSTAATASGNTASEELEDELITGGRIADLAEDGSTTQNRRFFYPPDVAFIVEEGQGAYLAILASSGFRAHPLQTATQDRMYMIRDKDIYDPPKDSGGTIVYTTLFGSTTPPSPPDPSVLFLHDATDNLVTEGTAGDETVSGSILNAVAEIADAQGWFIDFSEPDRSFVGEKSLSEPLILSSVAIVTTFAPVDSGQSLDPCTPSNGTAALFFINIADGTPTYSSDSELGVRADRKQLLKRGGIPPSPSVIITDEGDPTLCIGTECAEVNTNLNITKTYWYEVENANASP